MLVNQELNQRTTKCSTTRISPQIEQCKTDEHGLVMAHRKVSSLPRGSFHGGQ